jgi:hypothetical protein
LKDPEQAKRIGDILARDGKIIKKANEPIALDDGKASGSSNQMLAAYSSFSVIQQQQVQQKALPTIINRWILDPGSNIHVCNSTHFGWTETRKAEVHDILLAGGSTVPIQAWGKVTFNVNLPHGISDSAHRCCSCRRFLHKRCEPLKMLSSRRAV